MLSASIVLYKSNPAILSDAINGFLAATANGQLFLIDNSPTADLKILLTDPRIQYIHNPANPGFGAAHNIAIKKAIELNSRYHFIINPDIRIGEDVFTPMYDYMEKHPDVGMLMPKVLNEDESIQNLPKLLPKPSWIFRRKLKMFDVNHQKFISKYELRDFPKDRAYNVPILSGCFTLLRIEAIKKIGMYDEDFFMYFEDFDLSRRMHGEFETIYFPNVSVYHGYERGANKSFKLFKIFIKSMITYFNKWGWAFDAEREKFNKETLNQFK